MNEFVNEFVKILLSLSVSGTLLLLLILGLKRFYKNKFSRRWQYYIWLIAALRFLLPFAPDTMNIGSLFGLLHTTVITNKIPASPNVPITVNDSEYKTEQAQTQAQMPINETAKETANETVIVDTMEQKPLNVYTYLFFAWSALALVLFVRKITIYQGFIRYIRAGNTEVSDINALNLLSECEENLKIKNRVELSRNTLIASPMMTGFFRPSIVLPAGELENQELSYIFAHELTHYKQKDMFYKWLIQTVVCIHWFNPFVYLLEKEVNKACELSCDEAVISMLDDKARRGYGDTLISFFKSNDCYKSSFASVTLTEGAEQLKERLGAIMDFRKKTTAIRLLTGALTLAIIFGAAFVGVYTVDAAASPASGLNGTDAFSAQRGAKPPDRTVSSEVERYYEAGSMPLFQIAFSRLDEEAQRAWMEQIYADGEIAFFSVCVNELRTDSPLIGAFAEKSYQDNNISFFSVLMGGMSGEMLEVWLDRALEDKNISFQSMLFGELKMDDELDALEKKQAEEQLKKYQAVGVTKQGKNYYYRGALVNIFLDRRPDSSFYMLDVNPNGTVNIKIDRNTEGEITGVSYMDEEEVAELFGDFGDEEEIPLINTREWDSSAVSAITAYYTTDNIYILPSGTDKIILKEYLTENQPNYYASAEMENGALTLRSGDRPATNYKSYIELYVPNAVLDYVKVGTVSGAITVADYSGILALFAANGSIKIFDANIAGDIATVSGSIELHPVDLFGDLYVHSTTGKILEAFPAAIPYNLKAETVRGKIESSHFNIQDENEKEFSGIVGKNPKFTVTLKTLSGVIEID